MKDNTISLFIQVLVCLKQNVIEIKNFVILVLVACSICLVAFRSIIFYITAFLAANKFHKNMLDSIINAKIRFFDLNPIGRIMNRFSKDIGNLDDSLPVVLFDFLQVELKANLIVVSN